MLYHFTYHYYYHHYHYTGVADGGALKEAQFGTGSGHIWLDEIQCEGSEYFLHQCNHDAFGVNDCIHLEDASVICQRKSHCMYSTIMT